MSEWQGVCRHSAHACARLGVGLECLAIGVSVAFISIVVCARSMRDAVQTPSKFQISNKKYAVLLPTRVAAVRFTTNSAR